MSDKIKDLADTLLDSKYSFILSAYKTEIHPHTVYEFHTSLLTEETQNSLSDIGQSKKLIVIPERELEAFLHRMVELSLK